MSGDLEKALKRQNLHKLTSYNTVVSKRKVKLYHPSYYNFYNMEYVCECNN